nr:hypothetical protein [Dyella sp. ASV24]
MSWNDWHTFKEGQARFAGGIRGVDELGHETFAVRLDSGEYFGEIKEVWLPNEHDFNLEILSFGYASQGDAGMPLPTWSSRSFSPTDLARVMSLVMQLVRAVAESDDKPFVMSGDADSHFMGQVFFRDGWALVADGASERAS